MPTRTPYEQTQLARHGIRNQELADDPDAPVEYITEKCEASGLIFTVTPDTLIPRIETESLVELSLESLRRIIENTSDTQTIYLLDVGTGSGYVGITIAKKLADEYPNLTIQLILSDISAEALSVALLNARVLLQESTNKSKVTFKVIHSDLLQSIEKRPFHLITANLPYIPSDRIETLDASVKDFEPTKALDGGRDGLDLIVRLLEQIPGFLERSGSVWLEVDHTHSEEVFDTALQKHGVDSSQYTFTFLSDEFGNNRFVECRLR